MAALINDNGIPNSDTQPNKRRRKKSMVWEHFTIENIDAECTRAFCKQCKKSFAYITGSKLAGTSHLKRHIALGICPISRHNQENNQLAPYTPNSKTNGSADAIDRPRKRHRATPGFAGNYIDQERCRHEIAKMIIQHDYPLHMVEHSGFVGFAQALHPQYNSVNINTIEEYMVSIYLREKQNLLNILAGIPGRVSLSLDLWNSDQSLGYAILTGHFVDCDWKLHRRVLSVITLPFPDSEVAFNHAVSACLTDWYFEGKLFTLTLNHSFSSETIRGNLRDLLSIRNPVIINGQLIIGSCYARVLSSVAQEALWSMKKTIEKVRRSVKYIIISESHRQMFAEVKQQLQVPSSKSLVIDEETNWNTTYEMLLAASELKEVFPCLDFSDSERLIPSLDEWRQVETLCTYLKLLHDAASILTAEVYPTSNTFFHEVWKIQLELMHATMSQDLFVRYLTRPLKDIFDRYWKDCNLVLAVAVVMDPRFKMKLVEFSFSRIYSDDADTWIKLVDEGVHELYLEYVLQSLPPPTFLEEASESVIKTEGPQDDDLSTADDGGLADFDIDISEIMSGQQMKSELDQYLEESLLPRVQDFDALGWWKLNRLKYPTLSKMASDVLSIPVSTVAPDSVFDTAVKKMDSVRSTLRPTTLEALLCAKDWLRYESQEIISEIPNATVKMEY